MNYPFLSEKHLDTPETAIWILRKLDMLLGSNRTEVEELIALFHDISINRLLDQSDRRVLQYLFTTLLKEKFKPHVRTIIERMDTYDDRTRGHAMSVVASNAPDEFLSLLPGDIIEAGPYTILGILTGMRSIPPEQGNTFLPGWIDTVEMIDDEFMYPLIQQELIALAYLYGNSVWKDILESALMRTWKSTKGLKTILTSLFNEINNSFQENKPGRADADGLLRQIWDLNDESTDTEFRDLKIWFRDDAPLDSIDSIVAETNPERSIDKIENVLKNYIEIDSFPVPNIVDLMKKSIKDNETDKLKIASGFAAALITSEYLIDEEKLKSYTLSDAIEAASADLPSPPLYETLLEKFRSAPRDELISSLTNALHDNSNAMGAVHCAEFMGDLGYEEFIGTLIQCTAENASDFLSEQALFALRKIGKPAQEKIIEEWDEFDVYQKITGIDVVTFVGGERAVELMLREYREENDISDEWCQHALEVPDRRLTDVLRTELYREEYFIDEAFVAMCLLLDIEYPELPEVIKRKRDVDREQKEKEDAISRGDIDALMSDTMKVELLCNECGRVNTYEVENLLVDPEADSNDIFIGDDIQCKSCGEYSDYELSSTGYIQATGELLRSITIRNKGKDYTGPLKAVETEIVDGRKMNPREAYEYFQELVAENPDNIRNLIRFGNLCMNLGRERRAIELFERCRELDPKNGEAVYNLFHLYHENDRSEDAEQLLIGFFDMVQQHPSMAKNKYVKLLLSDLKEHLGDDPSHSQSAPVTVENETGRNDPCPCGSGKKYKKCCMR